MHPGVPSGGLKVAHCSAEGAARGCSQSSSDHHLQELHIPLLLWAPHAFLILFGAGTGPLVSGIMERTRFQDLGLRAGPRAGYIFCHQGGCEHLLVVRDIRRIHPVELGDPTFIASYPYCALQVRLSLCDKVQLLVPASPDALYHTAASGKSICICNWFHCLLQGPLR